MRRLFLVLGVSLLLGGHAEAASLFGSDDLDPAWCNKPAPRQTVIYIDDMMMTEGRTDWAVKLSTKLKASLAPGEPVTVVRLSPASGQSKEIWSGCWPDLTDADRAASKSGSIADFFRRDQGAQLEDQQKFFVRNFGRALTEIYVASKRPPGAVRIDPSDPPTKDIMRALASDEARFSQSKVTVRAVVYSDMAENSNLGSVFKPETGQPENYGRKLGTYLRHSVFYGFGIGETVPAAAVADETRRFWTNALASMSAAVGGLGADLNVPNTIPVQAYSFSVDLSRDSEDFDGRLSLLVDAEGTLTDSWLGISRLGIAEVSGRLRCQGSAEDGPCRLEATTNDGIATMTPSETLVLTGNERSGLSGQLGVKGAMFPLKATAADK